MKTIFFKTVVAAIFIIAFNLKIHSQNWVSYNPKNTCHYSTSSSFADIYTIKTDSIKVINSDTVFYLNKLSDPILFRGSNRYKSSFLLNNMSVKDKFMIFKDTIEYIFKINSKIGDSWTFDSLNSIKARIDTIVIDTIFNQQDSIKIIVLSTKDTIRLAKKFGIVSFKIPNKGIKYNLIGIENIGLGIKIPGFYDFFNFDIGDVFEYTIHEFNTPLPGHGYSMYDYSKHLKYEILSKEITDSLISYIVKEKLVNYRMYPDKWSFTHAYDIVVFEGLDTISYNVQHYLFLKLYNQQADIGSEIQTGCYFNVSFGYKQLYVNNLH
jgi:hypothetical protein